MMISIMRNDYYFFHKYENKKKNFPIKLCFKNLQHSFSFSQFYYLGKYDKSENVFIIIYVHFSENGKLMGWFIIIR